MRKRFFLSLFLLSYSLEAVQVPDDNYSLTPQVGAPWFTGSLLAPSGLTIPQGHYNIEPYIYATATTGTYNNNWKSVKRETFWANILQPSIQIGLSPLVDFEFNPTLIYNYTKGAGNWNFGDMPLEIDIQLYKTDKPVTSWNMGLKLALRETIPFGKYKNLNPSKLLTDVGGQGTWQTSVGLDWGNLFYLTKIYFITWRTAIQYAYSTPVSVKNLNVYGGGEGTKGTSYPAQNIQLVTSIELNMSRNWGFAMDILGIWNGKTRFKGTTTAPMTSPSSLQFSLAPALEYNWSDQLGLIFGCWFTVAGQNSPKFTSGVIALNYYK